MSDLQLEGIIKRFGTTPVVNGVSLDVRDGELIALLGPSGSGKTTLLRLIAGFETADAGRIIIGGDDVTQRSALERRCGMVFQHYALFPHLTVGENVGYGLAQERLDRRATETRVAEALAMVDLAGSEKRNVTSLSGGQQQRVALARALAPQPGLLLLDEPLSNLDPSLRERTRGELRELVKRVGITTILVTHEQEEAFDLADRIAVLHGGQLQQIGAPEALYDTPATAFVAGFVGRASRLEGVVTAEPVGILAGGHLWPLTEVPAFSGKADLLVRPDALRFDSRGDISGLVVRRRFAGASTFYNVRLSQGGLVEVNGPAAGAREGENVTLALTGSGLHAFPAATT